jgi:hypothetical protein
MYTVSQFDRERVPPVLRRAPRVGRHSSAPLRHLAGGDDLRIYPNTRSRGASLRTAKRSQHVTGTNSFESLLPVTDS